MKAYKFTAFEPNGELIIEETWNYENDDEAKKQGEEDVKLRLIQVISKSA